MQVSILELAQMHKRVCWKFIAVKELTRQEKRQAQEGLMLLTREKMVRSKDN